MFKINCEREITNALLNYLNQKSLFEVLKAFDDQKPLEEIVQNDLLNFYCTKIFNESESIYSNSFKQQKSHLPADLFIEQCNFFHI